MQIRRFALAAILAVVIGPSAFAQAGGKSKDGYLTKDGNLAAPFSLKDSQGGFAGFTGNLYVVKPDGAWTITRVFNQRKFKPHASGRLSSKQLRTLAAALAANRVDKLPPTSGSRAQANPLLITVTFGRRQSVCALPAGIDDPGKLPTGLRGDVGRRVLALRKAVKRLLSDKRKKS
jgi:hypothetical protein